MHEMSVNVCGKCGVSMSMAGVMSSVNVSVVDSVGGLYSLSLLEEALCCHYFIIPMCVCLNVSSSEMAGYCSEAGSERS